MPQTGQTPIQLYRSTTAAAAPTAGNLAAGELAINTTDGVLFYKDPAGDVQAFSSGGGASVEAVASGALSNGDVVVVNSDGTVSVVAGVTQEVGSTNLTTSNFIGISDGDYSDAATATIQTMGAVDDAQSGLTAGQAYYVQNDGTLNTTPGTPSVFAGTAVASTKLIVKG